MNDIEAKPAMQTVNIQCVPADINHMQAVVTRTYKKMAYQNLAMCVSISVVCGLLSFAVARLLLNLAGYNALWAQIGLYIIIFIALLTVVMRSFSGIVQKERFNALGSFLAPQQIILTNDCLKITSPVMLYNIFWRGILRTENTKEALLYFVDNMQAIYIPKRCFATLEAAAAFHRQAEEYWQAAQAQPASGAPL